MSLHPRVPSRLVPASTVLLVVDVQERLAPAMDVPAFAKVLANAALLLDSAKELGAMVMATEQYPKGLGGTVPDIASRLSERGVVPFAKTSFDAFGDPAFALAFEHHAPKAAVVMGMETHVCVFQTVRSLLERGIATYVVADAVASRREEHRQIGLRLCEGKGAHITTAETVVFDWLEKAGTDSFKTISKWIRAVP